MELNLLVISSIFIAFFIYFFTAVLEAFRVSWKTRNMNGPRGWPLLGNVLDFMRPHEEYIPLIMSWWTTYKADKLIKASIVNEVFVFPTNSQLLENIINSSQHITKSNEYKYFLPWLGTGLLTSTGKKWRSRRKMITPAFHFKILEHFIAVFNEHSEILVKKLREEKNSSFDIFPYVTRCTLDIICDSAMGRHVNSQENKDSKYLKALYRISDIIQKRQLLPWMWSDLLFSLLPDGRKHKDCLDILHGFTEKVILEKKKELKKKNSSPEIIEPALGTKKRLAFLDLLLEESERGEKLSDEDLREEVDTFMFEGHDTTASGISWTLYLLGHNPEIQKRAQSEVDSVLGKENCSITAEHLTNLKYLECIIKEALRLYPPVPIVARKLEQDVTIDGYSVPAGVGLYLFIYGLHRDETVFPDPEKFDPDRFFQDNKADRHPYSYIPFSAGPRNCIGQKFALMEEKIVLAHVLRSFNIESIVPREELKLLIEAILRPKDGITVKLTSRR